MSQSSTQYILSQGLGSWLQSGHGLVYLKKVSLLRGVLTQELSVPSF